MRKLATPAFLGALLLLSSIPLAAHDGAPGHAHAQRSAAPLGRYSLARFDARAGEVEVVDRATGRIFALSLDRKECVMVDPLQGAIVTRELIEEEVKTSGGAAPAWPVRDDQTGLRFTLYSDPRGLLNGGAPAMFDIQTGRLLWLRSAGQLSVVDAVEGKRTLRTLRAKDAIGLVARSRSLRHQELARAALLRIAAAQNAYHQRANRFGTLEDLVGAKLLSPAEARCEGYRIWTAPAKGREAQQFLACANSTSKSSPAYALTEARQLYVSEAGIPEDPSGQLPPAARPFDPSQPQPGQPQPGQPRARLPR